MAREGATVVVEACFALPQLCFDVEEEPRGQCCYRAEVSAREPYRPPNLSRLVLFCIDTSDSEKWRIFQHFSRSTRLAFLCTGPILIFALFCNFSLNFPNVCRNFRIFQQIEHFSFQISWNSAEISGNCRELPELRKFSILLKKFENLTKF